MTIIHTAKITSKGQVTIPNQVRKILNLKEGASIAFGLSKEGVILMPCRVTIDSPYTVREWQKIEKIASSKGIYKTGKEAKKHIESL
ncbi:MAG: AbrB/MazE/SpoVT family DNA-binding domain-containing protein [Candidatus Omnitrophota bacterium]|jgi:AbrB family looped-hinge helix DNA binding protein